MSLSKFARYKLYQTFVLCCMLLLKTVYYGLVRYLRTNGDMTALKIFSLVQSWLQCQWLQCHLNTLFIQELNSSSYFSSCSTSFLLRNNSSFEILSSCVSMFNLLDNFLPHLFLNPSSTFLRRFVICSLRD